MINVNAITIEDCMDIHDKKGGFVLIKDGTVVNTYRNALSTLEIIDLERRSERNEYYH